MGLGASNSQFMKYAIVDIETTGGNFPDRITEIAIFVHDGKKILDKYQTLINPECYISPFITQLTGITNQMVENAPKFYEVAKDIVQFTENCVFVAHNVNFDYNFIKAEFQQLGYDYRRKLLCTVRLSRKFFPNLGSYKLTSLTSTLNISHGQAHRAESDAHATAMLFGMIYEKAIAQNDNDFKNEDDVFATEITLKQMPPKLPIAVFDNLPEETGVYYMHDEKGAVIYVGKSNNIKSRIASHFAPNLKLKKSISLKNEVADISYQLTGSELVALLLEDSEIKKYMPRFNQAQRRTKSPYAIYGGYSNAGYLQFWVGKTQKNLLTPLALCQSLEQGRRLLHTKIQDFTLCPKMCNLYQVKGACFDHQIHKCKGACIGEEDAESYNQRALMAQDFFHSYAGKNCIIWEKGRNTEEKSMIVIEKGLYIGWGYIQKEDRIYNFEDAKSYITRQYDNRDIQKIITAWIKKYPKSIKNYKVI